MRLLSPDVVLMNHSFPHSFHQLRHLNSLTPPLDFTICRATLAVGASFCLFLVWGYCSLPDVTLTPPRMFLLGALVQVLLVPPSGYRCFRRRPCCLASVLGVIAVHWFLLFIVSHGIKDLWPCVGIFPSTPCFPCCWSAVCTLTEVFIIVWSVAPSLNSAKAHLYPFWCGCVPLPLSSAAFWLLSSFLLCGRCRCVCFVLASPPCVICFPHDGRVLFGVFGVFWLTCCVDTEVTALHQCSVISPYYIDLSFSPHEFVCGGADFCHRPPSPFYLFLVLLWL